MDNRDSIAEIIQGRNAVVLKGVDELARMWRTIVSGIGLNEAKFESLLDNFVLVISESLPANSIRDLKGNLIKALEAETITWSSFIRGLTLLNFKSTEIILAIHIGNSQYEYPIKLQTAGGVGSFAKLTSPDIEYAIQELKNAWIFLRDQCCIGRNESWETLLGQYIEKEVGNGDAKARTRLRSSIRQRIEEGTISWDAFLLGVKILEVESLKITVRFGGAKVRRFELVTHLDAYKGSKV